MLNKIKFSAPKSLLDQVSLINKKMSEADQGNYSYRQVEGLDKIKKALQYFNNNQQDFNDFSDKDKRDLQYLANNTKAFKVLEDMIKKGYYENESVQKVLESIGPDISINKLHSIDERNENLENINQLKKIMPDIKEIIEFSEILGSKSSSNNKRNLFIKTVSKNAANLFKHGFIKYFYEQTPLLKHIAREDIDFVTDLAKNGRDILSNIDNYKQASTILERVSTGLNIPLTLAAVASKVGLHAAAPDDIDLHKKYPEHGNKTQAHLQTINQGYRTLGKLVNHPKFDFSIKDDKGKTSFDYAVELKRTPAITTHLTAASKRDIKLDLNNELDLLLKGVKFSKFNLEAIKQTVPLSKEIKDEATTLRAKVLKAYLNNPDFKNMAFLKSAIAENDKELSKFLLLKMKESENLNHKEVKELTNYINSTSVSKDLKKQILELTSKFLLLPENDQEFDNLQAFLNEDHILAAVNHAEEAGEKLTDIEARTPLLPLAIRVNSVALFEKLVKAGVNDLPKYKNVDLVSMIEKINPKNKEAFLKLLEMKAIVQETQYPTLDEIIRKDSILRTLQDQKDILEQLAEASHMPSAAASLGLMGGIKLLKMFDKGKNTRGLYNLLDTAAEGYATYKGARVAANLATIAGVNKKIEQRKEELSNMHCEKIEQAYLGYSQVVDEHNENQYLRELRGVKEAKLPQKTININTFSSGTIKPAETAEEKLARKAREKEAEKVREAEARQRAKEEAALKAKQKAAFMKVMGVGAAGFTSLISISYLNKQISEHNYRNSDEGKIEIISEALRNNDSETILKYDQQGYNFDETFEDKLFSLVEKSYSDWSEAEKSLLDVYDNLEVTNSDGKSLLNYALSKRNFELVDTLINEKEIPFDPNSYVDKVENQEMSVSAFSNIVDYMTKKSIAESSGSETATSIKNNFLNSMLEDNKLRAAHGVLSSGLQDLYVNNNQLLLEKIVSNDMNSSEAEKELFATLKTSRVINMNTANSEGVPYLIAAAKDESNVAMQNLIDFNADVNVSDDNGDNALHHIMARGNVELAKLLLDAKPLGAGIININHQNSQGLTPLMIAYVNDVDHEISIEILNHAKNKGLVVNPNLLTEQGLSIGEIIRNYVYRKIENERQNQAPSLPTPEIRRNLSEDPDVGNLNF
jgi:ankyrin repeat protein